MKHIAISATFAGGCPRLGGARSPACDRAEVVRDQHPRRASQDPRRDEPHAHQGLGLSCSEGPAFQAG